MRQILKSKSLRNPLFFLKIERPKDIYALYCLEGGASFNSEKNTRFSPPALNAGSAPRSFRAIPPLRQWGSLISMAVGVIP
jgi:hypothetical protein